MSRDRRERDTDGQQPVVPPAVQPPTPATEDEVALLIDSVRDLRLTLSSDLSAAAGAVDAVEPAVARDILAGNQREIERFQQLLRDGVEPAAAAAAATWPTGQPRPDRPRASSLRTPEQRRAARRRRLLVLPAVPLVGALTLTAAAALSGAWQDRTPTRSAATAGAQAGLGAEPSASAAGTLRQLERVMDGHPSASQVRAVTTRLHQQLVTLMAAAPDSPTRRREVGRLLSVEQRVLSTGSSAAVKAALAASLHLTTQLLDPVVTLPTSHPTASASPTAASHPRRTKSRHHATPHHSASPRTSPSPSTGSTHSPRPTPTPTYPLLLGPSSFPF